MGKHSRDIARKNNPQLVMLVEKLYTLSSGGKTALWRDVARRLESPTKSRAAVNLSKLDRICNEGDTVLVPGKLLGFGRISKKLTVSAYSHSGTAARKLAEAGGVFISIEKLAEKNPAGSNIKLIV